MAVKRDIGKMDYGLPTHFRGAQFKFMFIFDYSDLTYLSTVFNLSLHMKCLLICVSLSQHTHTYLYYTNKWIYKVFGVA